MSISPRRRQEIVDALRRGTVPHSSLDAFAVGLERFEPALEQELLAVKGGGAVFKAIRGEYGFGKTFFARCLADRARKLGFATSEVQVSETETPLHRLETVYRRLCERLATADASQGAVRNLIDGWFYALEQDALAEGGDLGEREIVARTDQLMEQRLAKLTAAAPSFSAALRGYRQAHVGGETAKADALLAWLSGQPNVAAAAKRSAGVKGEIDHFGALNFLQGMLTVLRDSGGAGLLVVLDEVETIQRVRGDVRDKSLNALRQLIDEVDGGRFPGLFLLITGTPAFFDRPQGVQRLEPLSQRLHVEFKTDARFDNPRAVQVRLAAFDLDRLVEVGCRMRTIYQDHCPSAGRIAERCGDDYVRGLASAVAGKLGGRVGIAPRIFLKKLVPNIDWGRRLAHVEATDEVGRSRWRGGSPTLGLRLCQAMKVVLGGEETSPRWSRRAEGNLTELRQEHSFVHAEGSTLLSRPPSGAEWRTFAGTRANATLAGELSRLCGSCVDHDALAITVEGVEELPVIERAVRELGSRDP